MMQKKIVIQDISARWQSIVPRIKAVIDVVLVFLSLFTLIWLAALLPLGKIEGMFLAYLIMMVFPLTILFITRRNLNAYGLSIHNLRDQLDLTLAIFPVDAVKGAIIGWLLPMLLPNAVIRWEGALVFSPMSMAFFLWTAWILRSKPSSARVLPALLLLIPAMSFRGILPERLASFLFYLLFLGPGEEIFFRGYIQSRLNAAFGRPFTFWGVPFGWGLVITAIMFGFMHCIGRVNLFTGRAEFHLWWGVWTIFGGLTAGYIREKAGSVLPTAILHGLPQAIASLMFGFFSVR